MSSEWIPVHELLSNGDLLLVQDGNHGGNYPKVDEFVDTGVPLITGACLDRGTIDYSQANFLTKERADMLRVGRALPGDVLLTHKGTMGKTAIVPTSEYPFTVLNPQLTLYRVSPKGKLDRRYLRYYFDSAHFQELLARISSTSTISTLSIREQKQLNIPVPKLATQKSVVDILGSLDDRITLLRETNATLEAIAQALFKSWFVDFDPVRAKMEGRTPEGMDEATAALFPDGFETSELGEVPRGWSVGTLNEILKLRNDRIQPSPRTALLPYVPIESISAKMPFLQGFKSGEEANSSLVLFREGDVLFGAMRPYFHKVCSAPFDGVTRTTVFPLEPTRSDIRAYALFQAYQDSTVAYATQHSEGSTIPYAKWNNSLALMPVILPPTSIQIAFSEAVSPLIQRANSNIEQAQTLATLRDTLLPRLISGQLRLPNAEMEATTP